MDSRDREDLELFVRRADELRRSSLLQGRESVTWSLQFESAPGGQLQVANEGPGEETVRAYVTRFRRFVSNKDRVFLPKIHTILRRGLATDDLRARVDHAQSQWKVAFKGGPISVVVNNRRWSPFEIMRIWINGEILHDDEDKQAQLMALDPIMRSLTYHQFLCAVLDTSDLVLFVGNTTRVALREHLLN